MFTVHMIQFIYMCLSLSQVGNIGRSKKVPIIENVTFHVPHGTSFSMLGVNGSGKTAIFRVLVGEWKMTSGKIHYGGQIMEKGTRKVS